MGRTRLYELITASIACAACQNLSAEADVPAVLENPTDESRAELQAVLNESLGDRDILLAPAALTESSLLTLERSARGNLDRPAPLGRNLDRPESFRLVTNDGICYLIRLGTNERWPLPQSTCRQEAP